MSLADKLLALLLKYDPNGIKEDVFDSANHRYNKAQTSLTSERVNGAILELESKIMGTKSDMDSVNSNISTILGSISSINNRLDTIDAILDGQMVAPQEFTMQLEVVEPSENFCVSIETIEGITATVEVDWGDGNGYQTHTTTSTWEDFCSPAYQTVGNYTMKLKLSFSAMPELPYSHPDSWEGNVLYIWGDSYINVSNISALPQMPNAQGVYLSIPNLEVLPLDLLRYNPQLDYIELEYLAITSIPEGLFKYNLDALYISVKDTNITSLPANLLKYNVWLLSASFKDSGNLVTIHPDLFKYNVWLEDLVWAFSGCDSLVSIPEDLFRYNTRIKSFDSLFRYCNKLESTPDNLFFYNTLVTDFQSVFYSCPKVQVNPNIFGSDLSNRFSEISTLNVSYMFYNFGGSQASLGTAPEIWSVPNITFTSSGMFTGHSISTLTNYNSIPTGWK
jgi:hypothetical protein